MGRWGVWGAFGERNLLLCVGGARKLFGLADDVIYRPGDFLCPRYRSYTLSITVALVEQGSEGVFCNDSALLGPDAAVSTLTNGWSGWGCHEAATAAGIAVV